jgi:hypothetical protein
VYAVSPLARSAVKSQNLPSEKNDDIRKEKTKFSFRVFSLLKQMMHNLHCVSLMKPIRSESFSVSSNVGGTPEIKQNPNVSYTGR